MTTTQQALFNTLQKEAFLSTIKRDSTRTDYRELLGKCHDFEASLGKDISLFNVAEIVSLMKFIKPTTQGNARTYGHILSSYLSWAKTRGLRSFNPLTTVGRDWWNSFADSNIREYYSFDEIMTLANFCENPQDALPFYLLFEGVQCKEYAEIRNLKKQDVLSGGVLRLTDRDGSERFLSVHPRTIKAIEDAIRQTTYFKSNGDMEEDTNIPTTFPLVDSEYILRNVALRNRTSDEPVSKQTLKYRIEMITKKAGEEYGELSGKNVVRSGMIYYAKELMLTYGEINKEVLLKVAERYNYKHVWNLKEYINEDVIAQLYDVDPQEVYAKVHNI